MAKTAKIKKKQATPHSRASRRAISPTDPSILKTTSTMKSTSPPPNPSAPLPHVLAAKNAGITKSPSARAKPLKRAQRLRQQKGMERAEHNMDKLELKRAKSYGRERKVKERAKGWEDINEIDGRKKKKGKKGVEKEGEWEDVDESAETKGGRKWLDEEMDEVVPEVQANVIEEKAAVPAAVELEEEAL